MSLQVVNSCVYKHPCTPPMLLPQGYASSVYFSRCQFTQELVVLKVYRLNDQGDLEVRVEENDTPIKKHLTRLHCDTHTDNTDSGTSKHNTDRPLF